jgi:hypothetical protein
MAWCWAPAAARERKPASSESSKSRAEPYEESSGSEATCAVISGGGVKLSGGRKETWRSSATEALKAASRADTPVENVHALSGTASSDLKLAVVGMSDCTGRKK